MSPLSIPASTAFVTKAVPIVRPFLAASIALTDAAVKWSYGAWFEITPAFDLSNHVLSYVYTCPIVAGGVGGVIFAYELQIGTGDVGSEIVRSTIGGIGVVQANAASGQLDALEVFPLVTIPPNARVTVRIADDNAYGAPPQAVLQVALGLYPLPL